MTAQGSGCDEAALHQNRRRGDCRQRGEHADVADLAQQPRRGDRTE